MIIQENIKRLQEQTGDKKYVLVAISKTKPVEAILQAYQAGIRDFGENKVQELVKKKEALPHDIRWHMVGHLQRNKVKLIVPFIHLIHSIDSIYLLEEINKQAAKADRIISCLLQVHIAEEETKFGFDEIELFGLINSGALSGMKNVKVAGLMGMATFTDDTVKVKREFASLKKIFDNIQSHSHPDNLEMKHLSMGMSGDYPLALEEGSNMVRIGTAIFGERNYDE